VSVREGAVAVRNLNELEFIGGEIFANVWHSNRIARISPESGRVLAWIDFTGLLSPMYRLDPEAVLNGIAYDAVSKRLFVTGKLWPKLFEVEIVRRRPAR
jgi:glutaminyl-peptide cyclotransferase